MDFDIPQADELEWLEANSHSPEEDELRPFVPSDEEPPQSPFGLPTAGSNSGQKRQISHGLDSSNLVDEGNADVRIDQKRSKVDDDQDWLRYSPTRDSEDRVGASMEEDQVEEVEERIVSKFLSQIDGDFIPVTAPGGEDRVYAKLCTVQADGTAHKLDLKSKSGGLLAEPINVLFEKAEQLAFNKALKASAEVQADGDTVLPQAGLVSEKLWVDKYAPKSFTELLSDEQTNREVLLWLKQWDSSVFGSEIISTSDEVLSALRRHSTVSQHQKVSDTAFTRKTRGYKWANGNGRRYDRSSDFENDNSKQPQDVVNKKTRPSGPPEQKILLLCGPPGLGKTTLAHVAADHCGYRVVEVNASDDRSSSSIEAKILDVVQMNSVTADSRPKCLVIDEIDGALGDGRGAVDAILKMVSSDKKSESGKENIAKGELSGRALLKKGRKAASLSRPVICICNDLYAPALRPLRQVAKVHIFVQPTVSRVVNRLKYICNKEGAKTNSIALAALAEYTGGECDIRSCLNTLQFLNRKRKALNVLEIGSQVVGRKDQSKGVFDIWKEIFQRRKLKGERKYASSHPSTSDDFDYLHSRLSNRGDYDTIMDGIHENILHLQYHDPVMHKTVKCINSLGLFDLVHQYIWRTLQMPLYVYQPPLAITIHHTVAQIQRPNIEWPKSYQRYTSELIFEYVCVLF
ncbi:Chromosome transmission fidelity protein 18 homolog [Linum perenne]